MELSTKEQDEIIKYLAHTDANSFNMTEKQAEKVKIVWQALHFYDTDHDYTFSPDFKTLYKEKSPFK
jgi:hypothetical protein